MANESKVNIVKINRQKFELLAGLTRHPQALLMIEELEYYADENDFFVGFVGLEKMDQNYVSIVSSKAENQKYCAIDQKADFVSLEDAREYLLNTIRSKFIDKKECYDQGHKSIEPLDLFKPIVEAEKLHPNFVKIANNPANAPARKVLNLIMPHFEDVDGNFLEQFQTTGFDARLWEIYLFVTLKGLLYDLDRSMPMPDFVGVGSQGNVAIEAVTVGSRRDDPKPSVLSTTPNLLNESQIREKLIDEMPLRYGSALYTKLQKKYWTRPHIKGMPLVFAIADFHSEQSMLWSNSALTTYLYGESHRLEEGRHGEKVAITEKVTSHLKGEVEVPSGFFDLPDSENVSAVIRNNSATISKFNRIGIEAGYSLPNMETIREGLMYDHSVNALVGKKFGYCVKELKPDDFYETWHQGLDVFHNPNAKITLSMEAFPHCAQHFIENNKLTALIPRFHPLNSTTNNMLFE